MLKRTLKEFKDDELADRAAAPCVEPRDTRKWSDQERKDTGDH